MAKSLTSADVAIDQLPPIIEANLKPEIVVADADILRKKDYEARLAMAEEPVRIVIHSAAMDNPPMTYPVWNNGTMAEALINGQWIQIRDVPVETEITLKRKYVETLLRAKTMHISTKHDNAMVENPRNETLRKTSAIANVQVMEDPNPRGIDWLRDLTRRNF